MADSRISELDVASAPLAEDDLMEVVDVSDTAMAASGTNKQTTVGDLAASVLSVGLEINSNVSGIPDATVSVIPWDAHIWSTHGNTMQNPGSNPERIYAPEDGVYQIDLQVVFASNSSGERFIGLSHINGGTNPAYFIHGMPARASSYHIMAASMELRMAAGEYCQLFAYQSSGGTLDIEDDIGFARTVASVTRVAKA
jgi:hypothetical protein